MVLKRKNYEVDMIKNLQFGDPMYYEDYADDKKRLNSLISNIKLKKELKERFNCYLSLIQSQDHDDDCDMDFDSLELRICLAPKEHFATYLNDMQYASQKTKVKEIGVDSASYILEIDGKYDKFSTEADGYWGCESTFYRTIDRKKYVDAIMICISMPEDIDMDNLDKYVDYYFSNKKEIELPAE